MIPAHMKATAACAKNSYPDQASARLGLSHVLRKGKFKGKAPCRVYPCDMCDGWHLTAKKSYGRKPPPWDLDPNWQRPKQ